MIKQDYYILDYKFNLNIKTADEMYMGSAFITFSNIPSSNYIILNCDENLLIKTVRHRGKDIPYNYNQFTHTLHISCQFENDDQITSANNDNDNQNSSPLTETTQLNQKDSEKSTQKSGIIICISFQSQLNSDFKGFVYIDDETAILHLFPNFSSLFTPCDLFTSENGDINKNNEFSFKISNISLNITPGESSQIAACSIPFPQISNFIQNRKMFKFSKIKVPLPFFSIVIGSYQKYEIQLNRKNSNTSLHFFFDSHIDQNYIQSIVVFFQKVVLKIEEALNSLPLSNCIQVADVYSFPQEEANAAGIAVFEPETLNDFESNKHFIIKQVVKQFFTAFPATANEHWIVEGLASFLALVIMHSLEKGQIEGQNENTKIDQNKGQILDQTDNENSNQNESENNSQDENESEKIDQIEGQILNKCEIENQLEIESDDLNKNENEIENKFIEDQILNQTDQTNNNSDENDEEFRSEAQIEIDQDFYQNKFFRVILNADSSSQANSLSDPISMIDDETLSDAIYTHKSTCLFRMLFLNKTFEYLRNSFEKLNAKIENRESFTIENFNDAFNCIESAPFFESYFKNPGYPIIIVDDDLTIHQTRFTFSRNSTDFLWKIPIKITVLSISENGFDEEKTVSLLFDKKELNLNGLLNIQNFNQKLIVLNHSSETICRVWYRETWISKLCENAENLAKTKFRADLFNVFLDAKALSEMGFVNKKFVESFKMFQIPQELRRRFPMSRGNGSTLAAFQ